MPKHEFFVDMTCEGCSNAVTRVLNKLGGSCMGNCFPAEGHKVKQLLGVQFDIDLPNKKVIVDSEHSVEALLDTLKKTGKNATYVGEK